jgi:hypothetical protein
MKTTTFKIILSAAIASAIIVMATSKIVASHFDLIAIGVSYTAVAILVALLMIDYRGNAKRDAAR